MENRYDYQDFIIGNLREFPAVLTRHYYVLSILGEGVRQATADPFDWDLLSRPWLACALELLTDPPKASRKAPCAIVDNGEGLREVREMLMPKFVVAVRELVRWLWMWNGESDKFGGRTNCGKLFNWLCGKEVLARFDDEPKPGSDLRLPMFEEDKFGVVRYNSLFFKKARDFCTPKGEFPAKRSPRDKWEVEELDRIVDSFWENEPDYEDPCDWIPPQLNPVLPATPQKPKRQGRKTGPKLGKARKEQIRRGVEKYETGQTYRAAASNVLKQWKREDIERLGDGYDKEKTLAKAIERRVNKAGKESAPSA